MEVISNHHHTNTVPPVTTDLSAAEDDILLAAKEAEVAAAERSSSRSVSPATSGVMLMEQEEALPATSQQSGHHATTNLKDDECKEEGEGEYMLRWSEHNTQLIHVFHQLCQAEEFTDVTIATEGQQFKAHKLILSACSPYFRQLFLANPCKHPVVFIKDISDSHMRLLLEYMYRGSIAVKQYELEDILSAASVLKIRGLTTATLPPPTASTTADLSQHPTSTGGIGIRHDLHQQLAPDSQHVPSHHRSRGHVRRGVDHLDDDLVRMRQHPSTTTLSSSSEDEDAPLVVDESVGSTTHHHGGGIAAGLIAAAADKYHHIETSSSISGKSASRKAEGRKSSVPKKLRLSDAASSDVVAIEQPTTTQQHPPHIGNNNNGTTVVVGNPWFLQATSAMLAANMSAANITAAGNNNKSEGGYDMRTSPLLLGSSAASGGVLSGSSADNRSPINEADTMTDTEEIDTDQPVDFSTNSGNNANNGNSKIDLAPRYSILGSYLKTGLPGLDDPVGLMKRNNELAEDLRRAGYGVNVGAAAAAGQAAPWLMTGLEQLTGAAVGKPSLLGANHHRPASRDSRGDSREERNSSGEDNEIMKDDLLKKTGSSPLPPPSPLGNGTTPLTDTLGIDIAGRLRSHFLANLPSQSYAWLNGAAGAAGGAGAAAGSLNSLAGMSQLGAAAISGLPGLAGSLANLPTASGGSISSKDGSGAAGTNRQRRGSTDKLEKHPIGGVRTGEIGANGKPAVACEVCGKKLADPSSLYRHRKIHSGDKPHKCPYCPRRFIQRYNMKQHIKTHRIELMAAEGGAAAGANTPGAAQTSDHFMEQQDNIAA